MIQAIQTPARGKAESARSAGVAYLEFVSEPVSAEIFLDGNVVGRTPYTSEVTAGKHEIEFRKVGTHRRIKFSSLMDYLRRDDQRGTGIPLHAHPAPLPLVTASKPGVPPPHASHAAPEHHIVTCLGGQEELLSERRVQLI